MFRGFPGSLLEGMDHVDALREFGYIENSMFKSGVDADFLYAGSLRTVSVGSKLLLLSAETNYRIAHNYGIVDWDRLTYPLGR